MVTKQQLGPALLFLLTSILGCGDDLPTNDDLGTEELPPSVSTFASTFAESGGLLVALGGPLVPEAELALAERESRTDDGSQAGFETAFSGSSVVEPSGCASYEWMRLQATVTLTECTLEQLGSVGVDGAIQASVSRDPVTLTLATEGLSVTRSGEASESNISVTVSATAGDGAPTIGLEGTVTTDGVELTMDETTISGGQTSTTVDGSGQVASAELTASYAMTAVTWPMGSCLPTSGTVAFDDGSVTTTLEFLATTPTTGEVSVQHGMLPAATAMLLPPCP